MLLELRKGLQTVGFKIIPGDQCYPHLRIINFLWFCEPIFECVFY